MTENPAGMALSQLERIPWSAYGYYLPERPSFTFDPLFHAGCYYVQEASSMFVEQAFCQLTDQNRPLRVLDLCAAPGGKSTHLYSLLPENSLLVSNEVIRSRAAVLKDNLIRWGTERAVVTHNDPRDFVRLEGFFDVVLVDAPCSGSGLFRRDPEAIKEWSPKAVDLCAQRQQRILADIWPALRKGGLLIYSTCSYSAEEDEAVMDWIGEILKGENQVLEINEQWGICETSSSLGRKGYRFWPDQVRGEGFFLTCFRKPGEEDPLPVPLKKNKNQLEKREKQLLAEWINTSGMFLFRHEQTVYAWPELLADEMAFLLQHMRVLYSGIRVGELIRDKLVPDHALAMHNRRQPQWPGESLTLEMAVRYLQRKEFIAQGSNKGWVLAEYQGNSLGWMNILTGRINNYYPRELRILKDF